MQFFVYRHRVTQWVWHLEDAIGNVLAQSHSSYPTEIDALNAITLIQRGALNAQIVKTPAPPQSRMNDELLIEILQAVVEHKELNGTDVRSLAIKCNTSEKDVFEHLRWLHDGGFLSVHGQRVTANESYPSIFLGGLRSRALLKLLPSLPPSPI